MRHEFHRPKALENRPFVYKKAVVDFFCPLCRSRRSFIHDHKLTFVNYLQISLISASLIYFLYPVMKWKSVWVIFFVTCCFEFTKRVQRRKETPCPYCGFDASWYKTDVKRARKLVDDFWRQEEPPPKASEEDTPAQSDDITS